MVQSAKSVLEMDEIKFILFLSNDGSGHFTIIQL